MKQSSILTLLGFAFIALGTFSALLGSALWWPLVIAGGLLFVGTLNLGRRESVFSWLSGSPGAVVKLYLVYLLVGGGQELAGRVLGIWSYQGLYATPVATALLILAGFPLFLLLVAETHVALAYAVSPPWLAWVGNIAFVIAWSELPNQLAPLYHVNPPYLRYQLLVFSIGYAVQALLAVGARRALQA